jgi:hypothetical protein
MRSSSMTPPAPSWPTTSTPEYVSSSSDMSIPPPPPPPIRRGMGGYGNSALSGRSSG